MNYYSNEEINGIIKYTISKVFRDVLFEFNTEPTRDWVKKKISELLDELKDNEDIHDFAVICDTTNNTGEVIDKNQLVGDVYYKFDTSGEFRRLSFTVAHTGLALEDIRGFFKS